MNYIQYEILAELHREQIVEDITRIRLEQEAMNGNTELTGLFERSMYHLANWMVTTGKALRQRYERPCLDCPQPASGNLMPG